MTAPRKLAKASGKPRRGNMNKTEAAYANVLAAQKIAGEIAEWRFESVRFRLADGAWYCPDFLVQMPDGAIEFHEVKGYQREAAGVRQKVFAETYWMFRLWLVRREVKAWRLTEVGA